MRHTAWLAVNVTVYPGQSVVDEPLFVFPSGTVTVPGGKS
jgi:hypothetical protein